MAKNPTETKEFAVTLSQDSLDSQITLEQVDDQKDSGGVSQKADAEEHNKIKVNFITPEEVDRHANSWGAAVDMFYKYWIDQIIRVIKEDLKNRGMLDETSLKDLIMQTIKRKDLRDQADDEVKKDPRQREQSLSDPNSSGKKPLGPTDSKKKIF